MTPGRALIAVLALAVAGLSVPGPARAQVSDREVKAAFLPRFARYVTWPADALPAANAPFTLCVIGRDPFGGAIDEAARSQSVDGRRIAVRHMGSLAGAGACNIAFVGGGDAMAVGAMLSALGKRSILTVTDQRQGDSRGVIHFVIRDGRVRFMIDEAKAAERRLSISSRLLALAVGVRQR